MWQPHFPNFESWQYAISQVAPHQEATEASATIREEYGDVAFYPDTTVSCPIRPMEEQSFSNSFLKVFWLAKTN